MALVKGFRGMRYTEKAGNIADLDDAKFTYYMTGRKFKDETFKARKAHYTAVCAPTPAPSKQ